MARYIDANALLKAMDTWDKFGFSHSGGFVREPGTDDYVPYVHYDDMVKCVKGMPTVDVAEKLIDELTKEISERVIKALEENFDITPKKPAVQCKDCKYREKNHYCTIWGQPYLCNDECSCSYGESRTNAKNEEVDLTKMRVNIEKTWVVLREAKRRENAKVY